MGRWVGNRWTYVVKRGEEREAEREKYFYC